MNFYDWLETRKGMPFRFQMFVNDAMRAKSVDELELSRRAYNIIARRKLRTVGDLLDMHPTVSSLCALKGCGSGTAREVMLALFMLQVESIPNEEQRNEYLQLTYELNMCEYAPWVDVA